MKRLYIRDYMYKCERGREGGLIPGSLPPLNFIDQLISQFG